MKTSKGLTAFAAVLFVALTVGGAASALAQRTRTVSDQPAATTTAPTPTTAPAADPAAGQTNRTVTTPRPAPAPPTVKAKYEGGLVGYGKSEGTLNFDDPNRRLIFRDKRGRELFSVPYDVVFAAWGDTRSSRSTAGTVIANTVPYGLGLPGLFMKNKSRYLVLQYRDPDTKAEGSATFKLNSEQLLASVLTTFADKAGLVQRGDAFIRRRDTPATTSSQVQTPD
jgi:hypothetical protein